MATHFKRQDLSKVRQKRFYLNITQEVIDNLNRLAGNEKIIAGRNAVGDAGHKVLKPHARGLARKYRGPLRGWYKYGYKGKVRVPGTLIKSIVFQLNKDKQQINGIFSAKDPVAHLIEYGHRTRKGLIKSGILKGFKKKGQGRGRDFASAFPFMRPTIVSQTDAALNKMSQVLSKFINSSSR